MPHIVVVVVHDDDDDDNVADHHVMMLYDFEVSCDTWFVCLLQLIEFTLKS